jgi:carboxylate-amine ligase
VRTEQNQYRPYRPRQATRSRVADTGGCQIVPPMAAQEVTQTVTTSRQQQHAADFTIGLEEELFLVDAGTFDCIGEMPPGFLRDAQAALGGHVKREIIASMIELATAPHHSLAKAADELRSIRARLSVIAQQHGLALLASGTHPFSSWRSQVITQKARYAAVAETLGSLSRRVHVCGLHVHVAVPDPRQRVEIMNRAQVLPVFLALSTSSPFWGGAATGLKSYRSAAYDETPRTGLPIRFADAAEFERFVEKMRTAGFIADGSFLWWAIRPSLRYPTLELRIMDSCTDWRDTIAIAALYRCLVHALVADPGLGAAWEDHHYLINDENRWQAIRYGLGGEMLDPAEGSTQAMPVRVRALVSLLRPSAVALGCEAELESVNGILARGTSAEIQTEAYRVAVAGGACQVEAMRWVAADIAERTLAA